MPRGGKGGRQPRTSGGNGIPAQNVGIQRISPTPPRLRPLDALEESLQRLLDEQPTYSDEEAAEEVVQVCDHE
jgi:hypothetical protein